MPEQDREYRPNSQSTRKTEVESTWASIVTLVLALKVHEKLVRKRETVISISRNKTGHFTMSRQEQPTVIGPVITAAEPQLFVADVRASCDFFTQKLGFQIAFVHGDPPFFGQ